MVLAKLKYYTLMGINRALIEKVLLMFLMMVL